eukprot:TRINITY_DN3322_c0_g1_i10.p1 TRINITY_DN3322_c0_g1~~TRINITY_DN3322_c0_g1_i10.p1  ORF type:complete len:183 (+),score=12.76 TRINITY_DN3322_c0_g1_i10:54-602(+)
MLLATRRIRTLPAVVTGFVLAEGTRQTTRVSALTPRLSQHLLRPRGPQHSSPSGSDRPRSSHPTFDRRGAISLLLAYRAPPPGVLCAPHTLGYYGPLVFRNGRILPYLKGQGNVSRSSPQHVGTQRRARLKDSKSGSTDVHSTLGIECSLPQPTYIQLKELNAPCHKEDSNPSSRGDRFRPC